MILEHKVTATHNAIDSFESILRWVNHGIQIENLEDFMMCLNRYMADILDAQSDYGQPVKDHIMSVHMNISNTAIDRFGRSDDRE